jgi:DHA1 family bicyclomycin/chloramphenicol resistance-like MFS transporter
MDHSAPSASLRASLPLPIMAAIAALPPLAVDMYLPAFPQIAADFDTTISVIQNSLSIFLVGFGCGMLVFGPLADRYGRRPLALFGLTGFGLASLLLVLSNNPALFLAFRLLQGFLGSAATVTIPAMIRDTYGKDTAKGMSTVMMIMLVAPLIAPLFGSWILAVAPWQGLFVFVALYALILMVLSWRLLPETKPANLVPKQLSPLRNYQIIFSNHRIYWDLFTYILLALAFFVYLTSVSFIYITWFGVSETSFGYLFACSAAALIIANFANRQLVTHVGSRRMLQRALAGGVVFVLLLLVLLLLGGGLWLTVLNFFCIVGCLGIAWVNADALVILEFPQQAGSATAVIGTLRFGFGALAGPLLAVTYTGTPLPVAILLVLCLLGAGAIQLLRARHHSQAQ